MKLNRRPPRARRCSTTNLYYRGWSQRRIARELGIDREMVARYLHQQTNQAKPAIAPSGSASPLNRRGVEPVTNPQSRAPAGRTSACALWRAVILTMLGSGLSAERVYQDLRAEHSLSWKLDILE